MQISDQKNNLQDVFLNKLRKTKAPVNLFFVNGMLISYFGFYY